MLKVILKIARKFCALSVLLNWLAVAGVQVPRDNAERFGCDNGEATLNWHHNQGENSNSAGAFFCTSKKAIPEWPTVCGRIIEAYDGIVSVLNFRSERRVARIAGKSGDVRTTKIHARDLKCLVLHEIPHTLA